MVTIRRIYFYLVALCISIFLVSCSQNNYIKYEPGKVIIHGRNTLTETITLEPGTMVVFQSYTGFGFSPSVVPGQLTIANGGRLIAKGTKEMPIIFDAGSNEGLIRYEDSSEGNVLEYCEIRHILITIHNSLSVKYSKLTNYSWLDIYEANTVEYNNFNQSSIFISNNVSFKYNDAINNVFLVYTGQPEIANNNIMDNSKAAIHNYNTTPLIVTFNYIANCNGISGVDTTGIQSVNVTYVSPNTMIVPGAGCGW